MTSDEYPYWTYEELYDYETEEYYRELIAELKRRFNNMLDKDDMDYPPIEYWSSGV